MTDSPQQPEPDAGINALRLDADRARDDLEQTLGEIEARLNPQRVIQPIKKAVSAVSAAYKKQPVEFIATAVGIIGAVAGLAIWATRGNTTNGTTHG
ncbi:MAG: hypothetical protein JWQ43_2900 [Glaciihabitans sp.]|nr:hypothetical protein [Glaciihabitans sp.]